MYSPRQRVGMKKNGLSPEEMPTAALSRPNRAFPAGSDLRWLSATGADADGARAVAPTRVRNRHIGPARRCEWASVRGHLRALLVSDAYPSHQVALSPWSRRAGATWRGVARSFAQMGEAFGMRQSGIIACYVNLYFLASDAERRSRTQP